MINHLWFVLSLRSRMEVEGIWSSRMRHEEGKKGRQRKQYPLPSAAQKEPQRRAMGSSWRHHVKYISRCIYLNVRKEVTVATCKRKITKDGGVNGETKGLYRKQGVNAWEARTCSAATELKLKHTTTCWIVKYDWEVIEKRPKIN